MKKVALFAFRGEVICFAHVLLYALDLKARGHDAKIVVEGPATQTLNELSDSSRPFAGLYAEARAAGLIDCACQACAAKMGALEGIKEQGLSLCGEMKGHPSLARYMEEGYEVVTF